MQLRYRYRLEPTMAQKQALARTFGCARVVWNDALALSNKLYAEGQKYPGAAGFQKLVITEGKRTEERAWLADANGHVLIQSVRDLDQAFRNWWASLKGTRKGPKIKAPRFKKRRSSQSARFTRGGFRVLANGKLRLSKIGALKVRWSRELPAEPSSCTIIKDAAGRYFASFVVEVDRLPLEPNGRSVGIDLGLTTFATLSDGEKVEAPKPLHRSLQRLRKLDRTLSRKRKGSRRWDASRLKRARLHARMADVRQDFLDQLSTRIIRENQTVVLEDLNVSGMIKNRRLSRAISDMGWRTFRTMLEAKAGMYGREVHVISRWEPTSQVCSSCGERGGKLDLSVRRWQCLHCGAEHDRDENAAKNIKAAGLAASGRGARHKTTLAVAAGCEASTHREPVQLRLFG